MLRPSALNKGDIIAMDRAYIDYEKLETLMLRGVMYVTKMKKNLKYSVMEDCMYQTTEGFMEVRIQHVTFSKVLKGDETLTHHARIITYADTRKAQTGFIAHERHGIRSERDYRNLPQTLGDRTVVQADKTELPLEILLWRKCECHQDTDLGDSYS